jgi:hypothetical protein
MTLTKEDIRRAAINSGRYVLTDPKAREALELWVNFYYAWFQSNVWKLGPGRLALTNGPSVILQLVKTPTNKTMERFQQEVMERLENWTFVTFFGSGATLATLAFAKQICYQLHRRPRHVTLCDLFNWDVDTGISLGTVPGDILLLEIFGSGSGKVWFEKSMQILALLTSHRGPTILFSQDRKLPVAHESELVKIIYDRYDNLKPSFYIEARDDQSVSSR